MASRIGFICPTHKHDDYTAQAISTFFKYTPDGYCILVDDASPYWTQDTKDKFAALLPQPRGDRGMYIHRFDVWGGLTRSWNKGLQIARQQELKYAICGNNDILFTEGWYEGLVAALTAGYAIAGPVSNAPGETAGGAQEVWRYLTEYEVTDDQAYLDAISAQLRQRYAHQVAELHGRGVNGFFFMAETERWWRGAYDAECVFKPRNDRTSRGRRNPTPLMTLNEDELQARWRSKGWSSVAVPSSFIFHYRAVTRGMKFVRGKWHRKGDAACTS